MSAVIDAASVEMAFSSEAGPVVALRGATLRVGRGEVVLLEGPSGSGKTTLLSVLAGMLTATGGAVHIDGKDITRWSRAKRSRLRLERLGFVFQGFNLIGALTARENVEVVLEARGLDAAARRKTIDEMLRLLGVADKGDRFPAQLSGGEQQRFAIARALVGAPAVILADEPTSSLDQKSGAVVTELLCNLARERQTAVVIASHDERIKPYVDRTVRLVDGVCRP